MENPKKENTNNINSISSRIRIGEIRTMAKDIARIRLLQTKTQREKMIGLGTPEQQPGQPQPPQPQAPKPQEKIIPRQKEPRLEPSKVFKQGVEKPSQKQKYLIRILSLAIILVVVSGAFTLVYWYLTQKQEPSAPPSPPITEEQPEEPEEPEQKPEPIVSLALILVDSSKTLRVDKMEQVPNVLAGILKQDYGAQQLNRIIIKNTAESQFVELKEFFEIFQIKTPENLLESLEKGFTLFMYSPEQENRLGFVAKIKNKEQFSVIAKSWEPTMEQDFENLFLILGKTQKAQIGFKQAKYKQVLFNYISFPGKDFGICWAIVNDYFVLTSSGKTILKIIDLLLAG